jgi:hypothetical protein
MVDKTLLRYLMLQTPVLQNLMPATQPKNPLRVLSCPLTDAPGHFSKPELEPDNNDQKGRAGLVFLEHLLRAGPCTRPC